MTRYNRYALFILFGLLLLPFVSAALDTDLIAYYSFDDASGTIIDSTGNQNGTNNGAGYGASGVINTALSFSSTTDDYIDINGVSSSTGSYSVGGWFYPNTTANDRIWFDTTTGRWFTGRPATCSAQCFYDGGFSTFGINWNTSVWSHIIVTLNASSGNGKLYINGSEVASASGWAGLNIGGVTTIGANIVGGDGVNSVIDEFGIWERALNASEVNDLFNGGSGCSYACITGGSPPVSDPFASVSVKDLYDNASLSGLTVYIGTDSNTTDGSGVATVNNPTGLNYTVDGGANYFNVSGTATENATVTAYTYGALPDLSAYNVEGTNILIFNVTSPETFNSTTDGSTPLLLPPNNVTEITTRSTDYYDLLINITTGAKDTAAQNITGLYQTIVIINATNAFSGEVLSNWTGWIYNNDTGYNETFNTTGNETTIYSLLGLHTTYIDVYGYEIGANNFDYSNFTNTTETITFALYSENSIYVNIFNEETGARVYENITVVVSGNSSEDTHYTVNSTLFVENLTDGNYSLKFSGENYSQRTYEVTVANRANQVLNAYLSPGTDTVTFALLDYDTSQVIEGATILQQRLINSTWTTVESKSSDITGRAQFSYTIGVKYRFSITHPDYNSKVFELDPIIFTSYNIRLQQDETIDVNVGLFDVSFYYFPNYFVNEENNSFTFTFGSAGGTLQSYGFVLAYPGGMISDSGTLANGETFNNASFLVTGASYGDYANLTYWYDTTLAGNKTYEFQLFVQNAANNNTVFNNNNNDYGLGTLEKIIISIIVTIIFAGVLTLFGNVIIGLIGGLIAMVIFVTIGFLTFWLVIPTVLLAVLILMRRTDV